MAIGASSLSANSTGIENIAIGTYSLIRNNSGSDNVAIGHQALGAGFGSANALTENISIGWNSLFNTNTTTRNTAIGAEVGFRNTTGASNTLIGRRALYNNATGSNNIAIGAQAGEFAGSAGATLQSSTNSVLIGSLASSGNTTSSNEIVIGANALGLGSNTAVIGATTQTSATIYGLLNAPSGLSASGATFSGTINLNGQTFRNVVSTINGSTGSIGADSIPVGLTSTAITCVSFPSGITSFTSKIPYYIPCQITNSPSSGTGKVLPNRVYFTLHNAPKQSTLHTIRFPSFSTGITGNCFIGVYDVDINSGFPKNLLYSSTSITVASGAGSTSVTNASGLLTVPAGYFYIATIFNNTPSLYTLPSNLRPSFGSGQWTAGYANYSIFSDPGGFTFPTSLPAAGVTLGYIDYVTGNTGSITGLYTEYRIV